MLSTKMIWVAYFRKVMQKSIESSYKDDKARNAAADRGESITGWSGRKK